MSDSHSYACLYLLNILFQDTRKTLVRSAYTIGLFGGSIRMPVRAQSAHPRFDKAQKSLVINLQTDGYFHIHTSACSVQVQLFFFLRSSCEQLHSASVTRSTSNCKSYIL